MVTIGNTCLTHQVQLSSCRCVKLYLWTIYLSLKIVPASLPAKMNLSLYPLRHPGSPACHKCGAWDRSMKPRRLLGPDSRQRSTLGNPRCSAFTGLVCPQNLQLYLYYLKLVLLDKKYSSYTRTVKMIPSFQTSVT